MNKTEQEIIKNIIKRLQEPNCGASVRPSLIVAVMNASRGEEIEIITRLYIDTWLIAPLQTMLPGEGRSLQLGLSLSRR